MQLFTVVVLFILILARVLPLILMDCEVPNILKHLTYLDHTSEDVQPYFKEQLIDSLTNANKWIPATGKVWIINLSYI
jgi:hypothetical protein